MNLNNQRGANFTPRCLAASVTLFDRLPRLEPTDLKEFWGKKPGNQGQEAGIKCTAQDAYSV